MHNPNLVAATLMSLAACAPGATDFTDLQASCEALVAAETNRRPVDVRAISTMTEPTGTVTQVDVAGAPAPWLCRADASGVVTGVEYSQEG